MRRFLAFATAVAALVGTGLSSATAQTGTFRNVRPIEFHLAEEQPSPGLVAAFLSGDASVMYLHPKIEVDDREIVTASLVSHPGLKPGVNVRLTRSGVRKLNALVDKYQSTFQRIAITSGDRIVSAPVIEGRTVGDSIEILGFSTPREATALIEAILHRRAK